MRKIILGESIGSFRIDVQLHLDNGWRVVPQTYSMQSAQREPIFGVEDSKTQHFNTTYFIELEKDEPYKDVPFPK